jgi:hypothetical protein
MPASTSRPVRQPERFGLLWWLPLGGRGNGLTDAGWAPVADVDGAVVTALLAELQRAGVPAYAAPLTRRPKPGAWPRYQVWVGTSRYSQAEETLRVRLPALLSRARQREPKRTKPARAKQPDRRLALPGRRRAGTG